MVKIDLFDILCKYIFMKNILLTVLVASAVIITACASKKEVKCGKATVCQTK